MSVQQKIAALEGLLVRIEANRTRPRVVAAAASSPQVAAAVLLAHGIIEEAPLELEAPPELIEAEDIELFDDEIVELAPESTPAEAAESIPAESAPPVLELKISAPPQASEAAAIASAELEADLTQPEPVTVEAPISGETPSQAARLTAPESLETDFSDVGAGLSTVDSAPIESVPVEADEAPASSRRAKLPASMSEALAEAAKANTREIPLKTPPPESGPQAATPQVQIPAQAKLPSLPFEDPDEAVKRAPSEAQVVQLVGEARVFKPQTFIELLDATLRLGRGD